VNLSSRAGLLAALVLALASWPARQAYADAKTEAAREHYLQGNAYYKLDRYKEALGEYEAAYIAHPDPSLLYNIAQCHRLMGNRAEALKFYRRFLADQPQSPNRALTEKHIRELEAAQDKPAAGVVAPLITAEPAKTPPPTGAATPPVASSTVPATSAQATTPVAATGPHATPSSPSASAQATSLPSVSATAPAADTAGGAPGADLRSGPTEAGNQKDTQSRPLYKRWWFWTGIGAVLLTGVVIAAANKNPCEAGRTCK